MVVVGGRCDRRPRSRRAELEGSRADPAPASTPDRPACAQVQQADQHLRQGTAALSYREVARAVINEPDDSRLLKDVMRDRPGSGPRDEKGRFIRSDNVRMDYGGCNV